MTHAFGSFNPNFYGISLAFTSQDAIETMAAYNKEHDLDVWEAAQDDFDLARLGGLSVLQHEVRHFHDFLLSPFACQNMLHRLQATANGQSVVQILPHMPGRFLPTPITIWLGWTEERRADWFERDGRNAGLTGLDDIVPLPVVDFDATVTSDATPFTAEGALSIFASLSEHTARAYISLEQGRARRDLGFAGIALSATDMFEATAHLTQATCIYNTQGRKALEPFLEHLFRSDQAILKPLQLLADILYYQDADLQTGRLLEIFTWVLLGNHNISERQQPVSSYYNAANVALEAKAFLTETLEMPTADFWDLLDQITRRSPWRKNLTDALAHAQSSVNFIEQSYLANGPLSGTGAALVRVARRWEKDMAQMIEVVTADPDAYCDLEAYVMHGGAGLPMPLALVHYGRGTLTSLDDFEETPTTRNIFLDAEREVLLYNVSAPSDTPPADLDAVIDLYKIQKIIDFLFYEEATTRTLDQYYLGQGKLLTGKTPLHVF